MLPHFVEDSRPLRQDAMDKALGHGYHPALATWIAKEAQLDSCGGLEGFLQKNPDLYHDPMLLSGMELAVNRVIEAIQNQEPILIFGDFDVDGLSASSVLYWGLRKADPRVVPEVYLPNRFTEGHGLKPHLVREFSLRGIKVIITADCGMGSAEEILLAKSLGISVIVTDHHLPEQEMPGALAVVNPRLNGYPCDALAGVGVAYKFIHALLRRMHGENSQITQSTLINCLDYVAIGTVADVVPLTGENRYMVEAGLKHMMQSRLPFLRDYWNRKILRSDLGEQYGPEHVGFYMAPRLNAASRLDSAWPAFHFLTSVKLASVVEFGDTLENYNQLRVKRLKELRSSMAMKVHKFENIPLIVIESNSRELGLMGLLASSFSELYSRSVIALASNPSGELVGSARGIMGFNLKAMLDSVSHVLMNHGGHARAAGLRLKPEHLGEFLQALLRLEPVHYEQDLTPKTFCAWLDGANLPENFVDQQRGLGPFGEENARPVFALRNYRLIRHRKVGKEQKDLSMEIECYSGARMSVIGFGLGNFLQEFLLLPPLVGQLEYNYFGSKRVQLQCRGIAKN